MYLLVHFNFKKCITCLFVPEQSQFSRTHDHFRFAKWLPDDLFYLIDISGKIVVSIIIYIKDANKLLLHILRHFIYYWLCFIYAIYSLSSYIQNVGKRFYLCKSFTTHLKCKLAVLTLVISGISTVILIKT